MLCEKFWNFNENSRVSHSLPDHNSFFSLVNSYFKKVTCTEEIICVLFLLFVSPI